MILLQGVTKPAHGICLETREWKRNLGIKYNGSHVDWWWIYVNNKVL